MVWGAGPAMPAWSAGRIFVLFKDMFVLLRPFEKRKLLNLYSSGLFVTHQLPVKEYIYSCSGWGIVHHESSFQEHWKCRQQCWHKCVRKKCGLILPSSRIQDPTIALPFRGANGMAGKPFQMKIEYIISNRQGRPSSPDPSPPEIYEASAFQISLDVKNQPNQLNRSPINQATEFGFAPARLPS